MTLQVGDKVKFTGRWESDSEFTVVWSQYGLVIIEQANGYTDSQMYRSYRFELVEPATSSKEYEELFL